MRKAEIFNVDAERDTSLILPSTLISKPNMMAGNPKALKKQASI
jgi:hypothetical protein